jgi:serine/threonine protein kinase
VLVTAFLSAKISDFGSAKAKEVDVTMSLVGSPLFAGPELMQGELYDESVDVYSFGMLLLSLAMKGGDIRQFLKRRWEEDHAPTLTTALDLTAGSAASSHGPVTLGQIVKGLWDGWRPCSNASGREVPCAPAAVTGLVVRCCAHDPAQRPSMREVLVELMGRCAEEVEAKGPFGTWDPLAPQPLRQSSIASEAPSEGTYEGGNLEDARVTASQRAFLPARSLGSSTASASPPSVAAAAATHQKQQPSVTCSRASTGSGLRAPLLQPSVQNGDDDGDGDDCGDDPDAKV